MNDKEFEERYSNFNSLLLFFLLDTYKDVDKRSDLEAINYFLKKESLENIKNAIKEGEEILKLKQFPVNCIRSIANLWFENEKDYKNWLISILNLLYQEIEKQY